MRGALDVHRSLLGRDVPHEVVRLSSRLVTADDLPRVLGMDGGCVTVRCYTVLRDGAQEPAFAAVLVPSGRVPSPSALLHALDARSVSPARPAEINARTDFAAGLVSPLCLPDDVELIADAALGERDVLYCTLGEGGVALGIRTRDLLVASGARVATLTGPGAGDAEGPPSSDTADARLIDGLPAEGRDRVLRLDPPPQDARRHR